MIVADQTEEPSAAVLGEGTMGTTLAHVIASAGRRCKLWCADPAAAQAINDDHRHPRFFPGTSLSSNLVATADLTDAVSDVAAVIVAVPSRSFGDVARKLGAITRPDQLLLSATKGLEPASHERLSEVLRKNTNARDVAAIGGANITFDIMAGQLTALLVGSPREAARALAIRLLQTPRLRVYGTADLLGMETVSALKNVAAIAVGIAIGLELGINTESFVLTRAFREVNALTVALGGSESTLLELCGIGDLYLSCTHAGSLNRRIGVELGKCRKLADVLAELGEVPEGANTVGVAVELARRHGVQTPIADRVHAIMRGERSAMTFEAVIAAIE